jgi:predicted O-methyltransferase YrrM
MNITTLQPDYNLQQYMETRADVEFFYKEGEHYRFLTTVAKQFTNSVIYDLGTYTGTSAVALSSEQSNLVISYDIEYLTKPSRVKRPKNVEFRIGDVFNDINNLLKSPLIFMDIDPHDGVFEQKLYKILTENNYKGIMLLDDIHLNKNMQQFWDSITHTKIDYTHLGHYSGTGMVIFGD